MTPGDRRKLKKETRAEAEHKYVIRTEVKIHDKFASFLHRHDLPFVHSNPRKKSSIARGHPDFLITIPPSLFIEFKIAPNGLTPDQIEYIAKLERWGNRVFVITETEPGEAYATAIKAVQKYFKLSEITE